MVDQDTSISIDIGRGAPLVFASPEKAFEWIERQNHDWEWLKDQKINRFRPFLTKFPEEFVDKLGQARQAVANWQKNPEEEAKVRAIFAATFAKSGFPLSSDPIYKLAIRLRDDVGSVVAASALAAHIGRLFFVNGEVPPLVLRGAVEAILLSAGVSPKTPTDVSSSLTHIARDFHGQLSEAQAKFTEIESDFKRLLKDSEERLTRSEAEVRQEWKEKIEESIASISATEAAYKEKMRQRASVDYWRKQVELHGTKKHSLWVLGTFVIVIAIAVAGVGGKYVPILVSPTTSPNALVISTAITLLSATVIFWAGRVLVRLFLSAHHLHIDSQERIAMVQTFLALVNERALDEGDRVLVLTPLFRPSADGIVKDEGAPDMSLSALISRLLAKQP